VALAFTGILKFKAGLGHAGLVAVLWRGQVNRVFYCLRIRMMVPAPGFLDTYPPLAM